MYLTSMSREELYAEAHKDLIAISTKANMFIDKVRKKAAMTSPFPVAPQRMTITTTRKNCMDAGGEIQFIYACFGISSLRSCHWCFKQWLYPNNRFQVLKYNNALYGTLHATIQRALH